MSLRAILWAMDDAPVSDAQSLLILLSLCERADENGRNAWPSVEWLAERARCSTRTVHRHMRTLEDSGVIARGDQRLVEHLRSDRRPVVWDVPGVRGDNLTPRSESRGDTGGAHGVTPGAERGDSGGTQYVHPPTGETVPMDTSIESTPGQGGFDLFWRTYPRRVGKVAARKSWDKAVKAGTHWSIIVAAAQGYADWVDRTRTEARYVANPATWLNQGRWDDELPEPTVRAAAAEAEADRIVADRTGFADHWRGGGGF